MGILILYEVEEAVEKFYDDNIEKDISEVLKGYKIDIIKHAVYGI